jgi:hypothetical protein
MSGRRKGYFKLKLQTIHENEEVLEFIDMDKKQILTFTDDGWSSFLDKIVDGIFYCCKSVCVPTHMYAF